MYHASQKLTAKMHAFYVRGPRVYSTPIQLLEFYIQSFFAALVALILYCIYCRAAYHLFPCGHSTYLQGFNVALNKRLLIGPVLSR